MDMMFVFLVFLLEGLREADGVSVRGVVGDEIRIKCSHTYASSNVKYFCKGACRYQDILVDSKVKKSSNAKYSISDEGNTFYVTIADLQLGDSGTYWCGIERTGVDTYTQAILKVVEGSSDEVANASYSKGLVYIGAGLGVVVLALAMALLIFFGHRKRSTRTLPEKDHDTIYDSSTLQKENAPGVNIASSASENPQTDSILSSAEQQNTGEGQPEVIYSSASSVTQVQENALFYATISFSNRKDCSTVTPQSATCTYSSLKHI